MRQWIIHIYQTDKYTDPIFFKRFEDTTFKQTNTLLMYYTTLHGARVKYTEINNSSNSKFKILANL